MEPNANNSSKSAELMLPAAEPRVDGPGLGPASGKTTCYSPPPTQLY
eukprot:COSAG04_NODE_8260_length_1000_cov_1.344062_1_plen_46_part_10